MTQIAAALAIAFAAEIRDGAVEILALSSDGVDGVSRSSGAHLARQQGKRLMNARSLERLRSSLSRFDSASALEPIGALLPEKPSGTNVQDVLVVRIR